MSPFIPVAILITVQNDHDRCFNRHREVRRGRPIANCDARRHECPRFAGMTRVAPPPPPHSPSLDRGSRHRRRGRSPTAPFTMIRRTRTKHVHSLELGLCLNFQVESALKGGRLSTPLQGFAMTSSGKRSNGPGTCKHRRARNCPTRRDPCGRMSRPGDSQMAPHLLDNTRNRVGNGRADASLTRDHDEVLVMAARLGGDCRPQNPPQGFENIDSAPGNWRVAERGAPKGGAFNSVG